MFEIEASIFVSIFVSNRVPYTLDSSSISSLAMHVVERFMVSKL